MCTVTEGKMFLPTVVNWRLRNDEACEWFSVTGVSAWVLVSVFTLPDGWQGRPFSLKTCTPTDTGSLHKKQEENQGRMGKWPLKQYLCMCICQKFVLISTWNTHTNHYINVTVTQLKQQAALLTERDNRLTLFWGLGLLLGYLLLLMQNLTSYSCSATPISYKGDGISHLSFLVFKIWFWCGTGRWQNMATETEGFHTVSVRDS